MLIKAAHRRNDPGITGSVQAVLIFCSRFSAYAIQILSPSSVVGVALGAMPFERGSEFGGECAAALGHAGIALRNHLCLETLHQPSGANVEITNNLIGEALQLLLAFLDRAVAPARKLPEFVVGNTAQNLAKRCRSGFGGLVELRTSAVGNLAGDSVELLVNLSETSDRLFFEARVELARGLRSPFLEAASHRNERLFDQHLQTRSRLLLKPFRRSFDGLGGRMRRAHTACIQLFIPLRQRFLPGALKIVAKVCDGSGDLSSHIA